MRSPWITAVMLAAAGVVACGGAALAARPDLADRHEDARQAAAEHLRESGATPVVAREVRVQICTNGVCVVHRCDGPECVPPAPLSPAPAPEPVAPSPAPVSTPVPAAEAATDPGEVAAAPRGPAPTAALSGRSARALLARRGVVVGLLSERSGTVTLVVRAVWTSTEGRRREIVLRRRVALDGGVPLELRPAAGARALRRLAGAERVRFRATVRGAMRTQVVLRLRS